jgi:hypothetical protein
MHCSRTLPFPHTQLEDTLRMKASKCPAWRAISALLILPLLANQAHAQTSAAANLTHACGETVPARVLLEEVRSLRTLVVTWKLETQSERTKALEQSMASLRGEKIRLQYEQRIAEQQLAGIDAQIRTVTAGSEQHLQLEAERQLAASETNGYQQRFADLAAREADLDRQLSTELRRTAELRTQLNSIATVR